MTDGGNEMHPVALTVTAVRPSDLETPTHKPDNMNDRTWDSFNLP
jgi:hypothetical protein